MGVFSLKWLVSTFLLLFNTLIVPKVGTVPPPVPEPVAEPPSIAEPAPALESDPDKPANTKLYVLMYHHFVPEGVGCNTWMVTNTRLREDLEWLASHGYATVLPSQLASGEPLPERAVMLTFDDGYDSGYTLAYDHAMNTLYGQDRAAWARISRQRCAAVAGDRAARSSMAASYRGPLQDLGDAVNDGYLKAQGQSSGTASYGLMVDLLLADPEFS